MKTVTNFSDDAVPRLAASFSFYAMLSMAPLLILAIVVAGSVLGEGSSRNSILHEVQASLGKDSRAIVETIIDKTNKPGAGTIATITSLAVTFFSASGLFIQFNELFQTIWGVKPKPAGFIRTFIVQRVIAFVSVFTFGGLVLGWLVLDSWLAWVQKNTANFFPGQLISFVAATVFLTLAFALSFRYFPRHQAKWSDVWIGAFVAGLGLAITKYALSEYFSRIDVAGAYGPAGALVVIMLWVYYTSQVYFFGAELVFSYAHMYGSRKDIDEFKGMKPS